MEATPVMNGEDKRQEEVTLRDVIIERLRQSGIEVVTDREEGQRVMDMAEGLGWQPRLMGSRVKKRMSEIGLYYSNKQLTPEERAVADVFGGNKDRVSFNAITEKGLVTIEMQQGNENHAGAKHSVYRHSNTQAGHYNINELVLIPDIIKNGKRIVENRNAVYIKTVDGVKYKVVTEIKGGKEVFQDFYTNRKAEASKSSKNTPQGARTDEASAESSAKLQNSNDIAKENAEIIREHRVFHGSGADFDHFDHSYMGEDEGAQAYGWGTYVTEVEGIGRMYATKSSQASGLKRSEIESNLRIGRERVPFLKGKYREEVLVQLERWEKELDALKEYKHLYTVEIPDDTGKNYLDWDKQLTPRQITVISDAMKNLKIDFADWERRGFTLDGKGEEVYNYLSYALRHTKRWEDVNSQRAVSRFLSSLGFTGIKYPTNFKGGGNEEGKRNYVIFNEADAKITDHIRYFRTTNGEAYGFTTGGKIYIDPRIANAETPIHEYAHLWAEALRRNNPKEWRSVVELMKDTHVWDEVKKRYPELETDDEIADEVIATYSGRKGAERLRAEMQQMDGNSTIERVKQALTKFRKGVADFLHIHYTSADEVADGVLRDLLTGVNPLKARINNPIYTAYFVDDKEALRAKYPPVHAKEYYDHSTIQFRPSTADANKIGEEKEQKVIGRLTTDKVDALVVENSNANYAGMIERGMRPQIAHITLSTAEGVSPAESNNELYAYYTHEFRKFIQTPEEFRKSLTQNFLGISYISKHYKEIAEKYQASYEEAKKDFEKRFRFTPLEDRVKTTRGVYLKDLGTVTNPSQLASQTIKFHQQPLKNINEVSWRGKMTVYSAAPYIEVRSLAHKIKERDDSSYGRATDILKTLVSRIPNYKNSVLIPIPNRSGRAEYTLRLAEGIGKELDIPVQDILRGEPSSALYDIKKESGSDNLELKAIESSDEAAANRHYILVDNVLDTGSTAMSAMRALGTDVCMVVIGNTAKYKTYNYPITVNVTPVKTEYLPESSREFLKTQTANYCDTKYPTIVSKEEVRQYMEEHKMQSWNEFAALASELVGNIYTRMVSNVTQEAATQTLVEDMMKAESLLRMGKEIPSWQTLTSTPVSEHNNRIVIPYILQCNINALASRLDSTLQRDEIQKLTNPVKVTDGNGKEHILIAFQIKEADSILLAERYHQLLKGENIVELSSLPPTEGYKALSEIYTSLGIPQAEYAENYLIATKSNPLKQTTMSEEQKEKKEKAPFDYKNWDYTKDQMPVGIMVESAKVERFMANEGGRSVPRYRVQAYIDGAKRSAVLYPNDVSAFFEKDADNKMTHRVTADMLIAKYFAREYRERQNREHAAVSEACENRHQSEKETVEKTSEQETESEKESATAQEEARQEEDSKTNSHVELLVSALLAAEANKGIWMNKDSKDAPKLYGMSTPISPFNAMELSLNTDAHNYDSNVYTRYSVAAKEHMNVRSGQSGFPFNWYDWSKYVNRYDNHDIIDKKTYETLPSEEKELYRPHLNKIVQTMFNIDQTIMKFKDKALYDKYTGADQSSEDTYTLLNEIESFKKKHPDTIVLFKDGNVHKAYQYDAYKLSDVLHVSVETDPKNKELTVATFPSEEVFDKLSQLVKAGNKVAIAEMENGIFKEDVITKITDKAEEVLSALKANGAEETIVTATGIVDGTLRVQVPHSSNSTSYISKDRALAQLDDRYHAAMTLVAMEGKLDIAGKTNMLPEDAKRYEKLVAELGAGIVMQSHGYPARLEKESLPLVEYWARELKEDPSLITRLEYDVNNSVKAVRSMMKGETVDYSVWRGEKSSQQYGNDYTISKAINSEADLKNKLMILVQDKSAKKVDVILPQGASLALGEEVSGMNKNRILIALRKEGYEADNVSWYNAGGAYALKQPNDYYAGKDIEIAKLKQYDLVRITSLDVSKELKANSEVKIEKIQMALDDNNRRVLYVAPSKEYGKPFVVVPERKDIDTFYSTLRTDNAAEVAQTLGNKYYNLVQKHPDLAVTDSLMPKECDEEMKKHITSVSISKSRDNDKSVVMWVSIDGKKQPPLPITNSEYQRLFLVQDADAYKAALAAKYCEEKLKARCQENKIPDMKDYLDSLKDVKDYQSGDYDLLPSGSASLQAYSKLETLEESYASGELFQGIPPEERIEVRQKYSVERSELYDKFYEALKQDIETYNAAKGLTTVMSATAPKEPVKQTAAKEPKAYEVSPIVQQYNNLKQKHPDALILFRVGDFYESYKDDAVKASNILGITLTQQSKQMDDEGRPLKMAGFPYHALDTYLPKLIRAGERVAISELETKNVTEEEKTAPTQKLNEKESSEKEQRRGFHL